MELVWIIILGILGLLGTAISRQMTDEFKAWTPWIIRHIIDCAVRMLPKNRRERFAEEWPSHVNDIPGDIGKLIFALGCVIAALEIAGIPAAAAKRIFDIAASTAALAALLPMFAFLYVAVRTECSEPVLFRQRRIGFDGREFTCLKFRTMAVDAERVLGEYLATHVDARREWLMTHKLRNDPRITALGRFLRRSSLDELPQFFNVLMGHMSIVGPRPIVPEEIPLYGEHFADYASIRPGLTGLWQISGRNTTSYQQRVAFDVEYAHNRSFSRDIRIILATVMHVWEG
ncbi:MAG: sugar transferase [Xanthobacteraceae bacterium]